MMLTARVMPLQHASVGQTVRAGQGPPTTTLHGGDLHSRLDRGTRRRGGSREMGAPASERAALEQANEIATDIAARGIYDQALRTSYTIDRRLTTQTTISLPSDNARIHQSPSCDVTCCGSKNIQTDASKLGGNHQTNKYLDHAPPYVFAQAPRTPIPRSATS